MSISFLIMVQLIEETTSLCEMWSQKIPGYLKLVRGL